MTKFSLKKPIVVYSLFMAKRYSPLLLSLLSGLLLALAWMPYCTFFIFLAWVPLLILEDQYAGDSAVKRSNLKLFGWAAFTFLIWNVLVTWWVVYASLGGALVAFIGNTLLMSMVFLIYSSIKRTIGTTYAAWFFIPVWLAWEYGHTLWDLTWPWLSLGNVFANSTDWIQWYEYTGASGGGAWALCVNLSVFYLLKYERGLRLWSLPILRLACLILFPILLSHLLLFIKHPMFMKQGGSMVVVVQPNIDPYNTKFTDSFEDQFLKSLALLKGKLNDQTEYLVFPETFITEDVNEEDIEGNEAIQMFRDSICKRYPKLKIITGASSYRLYKEQQTSTSRKSEQGFYYDFYNTALQIDAAGVQLYHKSKLVPGVERMPFPALLKPLENLAIDLGGTMGSLGTQEERTVFKSEKGGTSIAPVICYESIYSDYLTAYIRNGANLIFIITNDGWWDDTPGYKQHLSYAKLRAIETRRDIARSANTGTSCFIDAFGKVRQTTAWWKEDVITGRVYPSEKITFFVRYGDLISYTASLLSLLLIPYTLFRVFRRKKIDTGVVKKP